MSQAASGYDRLDGDSYYTPAWVTEALLDAERFHGLTVDPAAGGWHIVDALGRRGVPALGFDINPAADKGTQAIVGAHDFLAWQGQVDVVNIVTNPPYGSRGALAVAFIRHALALTRYQGGKVAMLLRVDFDSASTRREIFDDHPAFMAKYTLTRRIRWANLEQKAAGPTENHAWFVWSWEHAQRGGARYYGYLPIGKGTEA